MSCDLAASDAASQFAASFQLPLKSLPAPTRRRSIVANDLSSLWLSLGFVALVVASGVLSANMVLLVYLLSFWHYYLYWLAYCYGSAPLTAFRRDAVLMKSIALAAFGLVYFAVPVDGISLGLLVAGFGLNALAARALGADRTYYGYELTELAPLRVTSFPYSVIAHPMLVGNIVAFGATLLNEEFRQAWWPLACAHMGCNLSLLVMELCVAPQRRRARRQAFAKPRWKSLLADVGIVALGILLPPAFGLRDLGDWKTLLAMLIWVGAAAYALAIYCVYAARPAHRGTN